MRIASLKFTRAKITRQTLLQATAATSVVSAASLIGSRCAAAEFVFNTATRFPPAIR